MATTKRHDDGTFILTPTAEEVATLDQALARFGDDVLAQLVTNWIASHAATFQRDRVERLLAGAQIVPDLKTMIEQLDAQATAALDAVKADPVGPGGIVGVDEGAAALEP